MSVCYASALKRKAESVLPIILPQNYRLCQVWSLMSCSCWHLSSWWAFLLAEVVPVPPTHPKNIKMIHHGLLLYFLSTLCWPPQLSLSLFLFS